MLRLLGLTLRSPAALFPSQAATPPICSLITSKRKSVPLRSVKLPREWAMGKKKECYAVVRGHAPGLYRSWDACKQQVLGYKGNFYKGFEGEADARAFLAQHSLDAESRRPLPLASAQLSGPGDAAADEERQAPAPAPALPVISISAERTSGVTIDPARKVRLEFDGASKSNPGPAGLGAALFDDATGAEVARLCHYMGDYHTNNQAEYGGLIAGMQAALDAGCRRIVVQGDSLLIVNQVQGLWQVKHAGLMPYHAAARALAAQFSSFEARQVPRHLNKVADALSNQAIDEWRSGTSRQVWTLADAVAGPGDAAAGEAESGEGDIMRSHKRQKR